MSMARGKNGRPERKMKPIILVLCEGQEMCQRVSIRLGDKTQRFVFQEDNLFLLCHHPLGS